MFFDIHVFGKAGFIGDVGTGGDISPHRSFGDRRLLHNARSPWKGKAVMHRQFKIG